jgi:cytochrome c biogenesis protein CcmG/thiol:disulfide interchange protein DsbE
VSDVLDTTDARGAADGDDAGAVAVRRRPVAPFVALAVALVLAGLFVVLASAEGGANETADSNLLGRPAPEVRALTIDGRPFDLARRKGSWVVLNFFTSTCVPCQREHPELVRFAEQQGALGTEGAELYSVATGGEERQPIEAFFADNGGDWPVVYDEGGAIAVSFGIAKVPETWIIDPDGFVRTRIISTVTADGLANVVQQLRQAS